MNTKIIYQRIISKPPDSRAHRFIFLVDDLDLFISLQGMGYHSLFLCPKSEEDVFAMDEFLEDVSCEDPKHMGTDRIWYTFVPACFSWENSKKLVDGLLEARMHVQDASGLFYRREFLKDAEHEEQLKEVMEDFVNRYAGPEEMDPRISWHSLNGKGTPTGVKDKVLVDHLLKQHILIVVGDTVYLYANGVYREDVKGARVKQLISAQLYPEVQNNTFIRRIFDQLVLQPQIMKRMEELNRQPKHWVNFLNGYYDPKENKMHVHDPTLLTINQIPREYDPDQAEQLLKEEGSHEIDRFMANAMPANDDIRMLWQYMGYCMVTDNSFQKFLVLEGTGRTGKSTLIKLTEALVGGYPNTIMMTLENLNKRFYATELFGKLLAYCADISSDPLQTAYVLKLVTGGDALIFEKKGKDPSFYYSYSKLLFSSNAMPIVLDEKTNAYARRLMIVKMNRTIRKEDVDRDLERRLIRDLDYTTARAMKGLRDLYARGSFAESISSREAVEKLEAKGDSVQAFIHARLKREDGKHIRKSTAFREYEHFCQDEEWQACSKHIFFDRMEQKGFSESQDHTEGRIYRNVTFRDSTEEGFRPVTKDDQVPFE